MYIPLIDQAKAANNTCRVSELELVLRIEKQIYSALPPKNLIPYYTEAMVQFGFMAMFANSFPLAPLFSFMTNLLEIKIKIDGMTMYQRRFIPENADGIGKWNSLM